MEKHITGFERRDLSGLEVVERLAAIIGVEAFEFDVQRLASLHKVDLHAPLRTIARRSHPSQIGISDIPFDVISRVCDQLIKLEPRLLELYDYRCRDSERTVLPQALWLDLVRYARECFDPAALDAQFLASKLKEGMSSKEAFDALITFKRSSS